MISRKGGTILDTGKTFIETLAEKRSCRRRILFAAYPIYIFKISVVNSWDWAVCRNRNKSKKKDAATASTLTVAVVDVDVRSTEMYHRSSSKLLFLLQSKSVALPNVHSVNQQIIAQVLKCEFKIGRQRFGSSASKFPNLKTLGIFHLILFIYFCFTNHQFTASRQKGHDIVFVFNEKFTKTKMIG